MEEISEFLLFTVTDGGHFGFYALENSARLFKRGVGAYFFYKYLKLPKTTVKRYLQKVGHGIMVLDPTIPDYILTQQSLSTPHVSIR